MNNKRIIQEIQAGNLVIAPTDTIYGILADATNPIATQKVFHCKKRSKNKALILLVSDMTMLSNYVTTISPLEKELIENYLPGRLTILLSKNSKVDDQITGGSPLVGMRIPQNPELINIIKNINKPLISTSVNLSGNEAINNPQQIPSSLLSYISYIEDVGKVYSKPSTIIKVVKNQVVILRSGEVASQLSKHYQTTSSST